MLPVEAMNITVNEDGPYSVVGSVPLAKQVIVTDAAGDSVGYSQGREYEATETYSLCRCGNSASKPFCDGSHARVRFDGTETASRAPYLSQTIEIVGPTLALTDAQSLCAFARFCDVAGQVWNLVQQPGAAAARLAVREAALCPSGRLVAWDRAARTPFEPKLEPSIALIEDPSQGVAGPIWVRGGITVTSADGTDYERRNRVTLCRCGASRNKPFCDGSHAAVGFTD
ncbi:MAG: hypothetical protein JWO62_3407 [Acidimicrobiaceae bacterium]|jgi:CDGSH-type Zn-finger protein|nr:hypothetical protein [Acidimicrobiaceae bacterium]